jgi:hypothetical protein
MLEHNYIVVLPLNNLCKFACFHIKECEKILKNRYVTIIEISWVINVYNQITHTCKFLKK